MQSPLFTHRNARPWPGPAIRPDTTAPCSIFRRERVVEASRENLPVACTQNWDYAFRDFAFVLFSAESWRTGPEKTRAKGIMSPEVARIAQSPSPAGSRARIGFLFPMIRCRPGSAKSFVALHEKQSRQRLPPREPAAMRAR